MDQRANGYGWNERILFYASFLTLIAAGIGFSVRGAILQDWGEQFGFTQTELGTITGGGLFFYGITIIGGSLLADVLGFGKLMVLAFLLHVASAVVTFAATPVYNSLGKDATFWCLNVGMWLFALGNGACEAVINPLTATLYPRNKTHWLNILHAGWPGGLVIGALSTVGFNYYVNQTHIPIRWEYKLAVFLIPVVLYGVMMFGRRFPSSEAHVSGVSMGTMIFTLLSPILIFLFILHAAIGYVELGTDSWIVNITNRVLNNADEALLAFIWTNVLMFSLRFFAGPIVHKISPLGLLFVSAVLGAAGLYLLGQPQVDSTWPWMAAVTVYALGKTYYWPTMLGVISERFPKGGALALGISGGVGMISAGLLGAPGIGYKQDYFAVQKLQQTSKDAYERYVARTEDGKPETQGFPLVTRYDPALAPPVAGLDNAKLKIFDDYSAIEKKLKENPNLKEDEKLTTMEADFKKIKAAKDSGGKVEEHLYKTLSEQDKWWQEQGKPNFDADKQKVLEARTYGGKQAFLYTAFVPAGMAVGFLLLILVFAGMGGYRQVHLEGTPPIEGALEA
jgi:MFS family permease